MSHSLPLSLWATPTLKKHWWLLEDSEVGTLPQIYSSTPAPTPHEETEERSRVGAERTGLKHASQSCGMPRKLYKRGRKEKEKKLKSKRNEKFCCSSCMCLSPSFRLRRALEKSKTLSSTGCHQHTDKGIRTLPRTGQEHHPMTEEGRDTKPGSSCVIL